MSHCELGHDTEEVVKLPEAVSTRGKVLGSQGFSHNLEGLWSHTTFFQTLDGRWNLMNSTMVLESLGEAVGLRDSSDSTSSQGCRLRLCRATSGPPIPLSDCILNNYLAQRAIRNPTFFCQVSRLLALMARLAQHYT